jgi:chromosome segregation ATPase
MANQKTVTNEDILQEVKDMAQSLQDFMQMTSDRFDKVDERFDKVDERFDRLEGRMDTSEGNLKELRNASYRHETELGKQTRLVESAREEMSNLHIDLNAILHRIATLERKDKLNDKERAEAQTKLQQLIDWAKVAATQIGVPLKLS